MSGSRGGELADPYEVLGVRPSDSTDTIRKAYRKAARAWHPDLHPDSPEAEERFKEVASAWDVLSDPARRAAHDGAQGRAARGHVEPDYLDAVAASMERAQDWLDRGVLPLVAARWRGKGAEALAWALADVEIVGRPSALPVVGWAARRRAVALAGELTITLSDQPGPQAVRLFRHRRVWEIRVVAWVLQQRGLAGTDLDDVLMRLIVESGLRCLAAGRLPVAPEHPDVVAEARRFDDSEVWRWRRQAALWGGVALLMAAMMTAGKMGW